MKNNAIPYLFAAAALCPSWQLAMAAETYSVRPTCDAKSPCIIRPGTFGYNDTWWRQWPTQYRVEISDPRAIGAIRIPAPPATLEVQPPPSGNLPNKPALPDITGSEILPPTGPTTGGTTSTSGQPGREAPGTRTAPSTSPDSMLSVPGLIPSLTPPEIKPGGEGGSGSPSPSKEPLLPSGKEPGPSGGNAPLPSGPIEPGPSPLTPKPAGEPLKNSDHDKSNSTPPSATPPKLESPVPSAPGASAQPKPVSPARAIARNRGAVAAEDSAPSPDDMSTAAARAEAGTNSNPELHRDLELRAASFEQRGLEAGATWPAALNGYCPVELQEKEEWLAGRAEFQSTYRGQVFRFASAAAQRRFIAAPEKYAPAQSGNDPVFAIEENRVVPGSVQHSAVWQGRLYLFASSASLAAFRANPARYTSRHGKQESVVSTGQQSGERMSPVAATKPPAKSDIPTAQPARPVTKPQKLQLPDDSL